MGQKRSKYYHNEGQKDASKHKYNPPHERVEDLIGSIIAGEPKSYRQDRKSYEAGRKNTKRQKGGCFLTTACVEHAGLPDDCHELQVLRKFRDTYVSSHPHGKIILAEYYRVAPEILRQIEMSCDRGQTLEETFSIVRTAVASIEVGDSEAAFEAYAKLFLHLRARYGHATLQTRR